MPHTSVNNYTGVSSSRLLTFCDKEPTPPWQHIPAPQLRWENVFYTLSWTFPAPDTLLRRPCRDLGLPAGPLFSRPSSLSLLSQEPLGDLETQRVERPRCYSNWDRDLTAGHPSHHRTGEQRQSPVRGSEPARWTDRRVGGHFFSPATGLEARIYPDAPLGVWTMR